MASITGSASTSGSILLLAQARAGLREARRCTDAGERFSASHLAALRAAAAVLVDRGRPASARRRLVSVWVMIEAKAPELSEWAAFFAAGAPLRAAVEAGAYNAVSTRQADDQVRAATEFLTIVEDLLGLLPERRAS